MSDSKRLFYLFFLELNRTLFKKRFAAEFDVTDRCNLCCLHCYNHFTDEPIREEIHVETWEKRFDDMYGSGVRLVQLMGGEPTLRMDVVELAIKKFPFVYISTNGLIRIPREWKVKIILSIDGTKEKNDRIRGKGVFEKAVNNYSGDNRVLINMVLNTDNYTDLEDVVMMAKRNNFAGVLCNIYSTTTDQREERICGKERKTIISEMRRVRSMYPEAFLMNEMMIRWFEDGDHTNRCHWRENAYHLNVDWSSRTCYIDRPDCSNCGCMAGALQRPLQMIRYPMDLIRIVRIGKG